MLLTLLQSSGAGPGTTVTQTARFDNAQTFYASAVTTANQAVQTSRFDNAQTFYAGVVFATQFVTQTARFDNAQTFYGGAATATNAIAQVSRFDNAQIFYAGVVTSVQNVTQASRFDNAQAFYSGDVTAVATILPGLYVNEQIFFPAQSYNQYPDPADVRAGVQYGPGGIYVGTLESTAGELNISLRSFGGRF